MWNFRIDCDVGVVVEKDWNSVRVRVEQVGHIAPQEILNAAIHIVESAFAVEPEELVKEVSKTLGFAKCGAQVKRRIEDVLTKARETGRLVSEGAMYRLPKH